MTDFQLKLTQFITTKDILSKRRGSIHLMSNSLKRNTINDLQRHQPSNYERKLFKRTFSRKDLSQMLNLMFQKDNIILPDRNFLRRIMYQIFDEDMIHSGGLDFVNHLNLWEYTNGDIIRSHGEQYFYFIIKGVIKVQSTSFQYEKHEGETFGQLQILANQSIQYFTVKKAAILLVLTKQNFNIFFRPYIQKQYTKKQNLCINIKPYLDKTPKINKYHFLSKLKTKSHKLGDKITDKTKQVDKLHFLKHYKGTIIQCCLYQTLGLYQLLKGKEYYNETVHCLDLYYKVAYIEVEYFEKYVMQFVNQINTSYNKSRFINNYNQNNNQYNNNQNNPQGTSNSKDMRIRKIKLALNEKMKTQPHNNNKDAKFKFFKQSQINTTINKAHKSIRYSITKNRLSQINGIKNNKLVM